MQNALGFAITMVSIQLGSLLIAEWGASIAWLLVPGPLLGLIGLFPLWRNRRQAGASKRCDHCVSNRIAQGDEHESA